MIERHYDDESLIALMESPLAGRHDAHVPGCPDCSGRIASFASIASILEESETWDMRELSGEPQPSSIHAIRAFAARMEDEDAVAIALTERLLVGPRELWTRALRRNPESRTAGVVRRLLALAYDAVVTMPPDAVEMTALATEIADGLDAEFDPTIHQLRGAAWRDRAYALYYTSRFDEALTACDRADAAFGECVVEEWDRARVGIVRSLVLSAFEKFDEAAAVCSQISPVFETYEDLDRIASAALTRVRVMLRVNDHKSAMELLTQLEAKLRSGNLAETHARVLSNLGYCAEKLGRYDEAIQWLETSRELLDTLGARTEAVRARWVSARVLARAGHTSVATARLQQLMGEMESLGMTSEAAVNALDLAELFMADGRYEEVETVCREAIAAFERVGLVFSSRAVTALGYICEAARVRTPRPEVVRHVREYIRQLPAEPNLLFAPRPDDFLQRG